MFFEDDYLRGLYQIDNSTDAPYNDKFLEFGYDSRYAIVNMGIASI